MQRRYLVLLVLSILLVTTLTTVSAEGQGPSIAFVVIGSNEAYMVNKAAEEMNADVTVYHSYRDSTVSTNYTSFKNMDLSSYDSVFVYPNTGMLFLGADVRDEIANAIKDTVRPGVPVIDIGFGTGNVDLSLHPFILSYAKNADTENIKRLIDYIGITFCGVSGIISEPLSYPDDGIYHPDADTLFADIDSYLLWYSNDDGTHYVYDKNNITIGLSFFDSKTGSKGNKVVEATIRELESRGINVIPAFRPSVLYERTPVVFKANTEWLPDAIIDFGHGVWVIPVLNKNTTYLQEMDVPVINAIMYQQSLDEWRNSTTGSAFDFQYQIPIMEIGGHIESIVVSAKTVDEKYGVHVDTPIPEQLDWMIARTLNWVALQNKENKEKKVAVIYYNHAPGRQSVMTASNLDVAPSVANLVEAMRGNGYYLGNVSPNGTVIRELVLQQGRNIGNWAPGEMEHLVNNYDVELLPVEQYMEWFSQLAQSKQDEVNRTWGVAPGDCMVYENSSGKYFVFPKVTLGNILLLPQPSRSAFVNDSLAYHDQTLPPTHQYIAFYMWLDKQFKADALINMGRHGTQEWLAGKGVGLSINECWPAILIQDMPSVYIYEVGGIGEGIQAKRRGNAVIVDHLTPPVIKTGLYGDLSLMHHNMHLYDDAETELLKNEYRISLTELYAKLGFNNVFSVSTEELDAYSALDFENFVIHGPVHDHMHELAHENMPYGLHILDEPPKGDALVSMVYSIVADKLIASITKVVDDEHLLDTAHQPNTISNLLKDVLIEGRSSERAVAERLGVVGSIKKEVIATGISDPEGNYCLTDIPNGNYTLVTYTYVDMKNTGMWFMGQDHISICDGQDIHGFDTTGQVAMCEDVLPVSNMLSKVNISGKTLLPSRSGGISPFANVSVLLFDQENNLVANTSSNNNGEYVLEAPAFGSYSVEAFIYVRMGSSGMWFSGNGTSLTLQGNDIGSSDISLVSTPEDDIKHLKRALIETKVSGKTILPSRMGGFVPFGGIQVLLLDQYGELVCSSMSNATGDYELCPVPDGNFSISSFVYVPMGSTGMWFRGDMPLSVQGQGHMQDFNLTLQSVTEDDIADLSFLLQRVNITGKTLLPSRTGGMSAVQGVQVVLIKETIQSSAEALEIVQELNNAIDVASRISACSTEVHSIMNALDGKFIAPGLGDDPIRSSEVIPTGRNFYSFNPNIVPTPEAWKVGKQLVDDFLDQWVKDNGEYPKKLGFILWSSETGRHKGVMEAQILYLMGIEPVWDSSKKVDGVRLIESERLGRPRIDVVVTMSGVYRDEYKWQVELMDRAARMACGAVGDKYPNFVSQNSASIYEKLMATGNFSQEDAIYLSECRIFGPSPGTWGVGGFESAVERADSWNNESVLADLYVRSMANAYGKDGWGIKETEVFREVLAGTDSMFFSRSGNDNRGGSSLIFDHVYEFYGGFATAVRNISGKDPAKFIVNLKDPHKASTETFSSFLSKELLSKYYNPLYLKGLMGSGYAGASEVSSIIDDLAGLQYTLPNDITDDMWNRMYEVYVKDSYGLGLNEWYAKENPWAKQATGTKMLEMIRKGHWDASEEVKHELAQAVVDSVTETGTPSCCHHTCGNLLNTEYILNTLQTMAKVDLQLQQKLDSFSKIMDNAVGKDSIDPELEENTQVSSLVSSGSSSGTLRIVEAEGNSTVHIEGGVGMDTSRPAGEVLRSSPDNYVEGFEMTKSNRSDPNSNNVSFSGADIIASILVLACVGAVYLGFKRRNQ